MAKLRSQHTSEPDAPGPGSPKSWLPLAAAGTLFFFGVVGLVGALPFGNGTVDRDRPAAGALGQPEPIATVLLSSAPELDEVDLSDLNDMFAELFVPSAVAPTVSQVESDVQAAGSGNVQAIISPPTPTATPEPTSTPEPTPTPEPSPTPTMEPSPTPTPSPTPEPEPTVVVPTGSANGSGNSNRPPVSIYVDQPQPVPQPRDGNYIGQNGLPPPQN